MQTMNNKRKYKSLQLFEMLSMIKGWSRLHWYWPCQ